MTPDSVLKQIVDQNRGIAQFYAEVYVSVYDPEAFAPLDQETDFKLIPYELIEKSFSQKIVFIRDEFISIETFNRDENISHLYIKEIGGDSFSLNFTESVTFTNEDVFYPPLLFYTKHLDLLKRSISDYGIAPVSLKTEHRNSRTYYSIGNSEDNFVVTPDDFQILELNRHLQINGRYFPMKIEFSEFEPEKKRIPELIKFSINSRLLKQVRISQLVFSRVYPRRNKVLSKYQAYLPAPDVFSLETNYGQ